MARHKQKGNKRMIKQSKGTYKGNKREMNEIKDNKMNIGNTSKGKQKRHTQ